jgi:hypothetical protein
MKLFVIAQVISLIYSVFAQENNEESSKRASQSERNLPKPIRGIEDSTQLVGTWFEVARIGQSTQHTCQCIKYEVFNTGAADSFEVKSTCLKKQDDIRTFSAVLKRTPAYQSLVLDNAVEVRIAFYNRRKDLLVVKTEAGLAVYSKNLHLEKLTIQRAIRATGVPKDQIGITVQVSYGVEVCQAFQTELARGRRLQSLESKPKIVNSEIAKAPKREFFELIPASLLARPEPVQFGTNGVAGPQIQYSASFETKCGDGYEAYFGVAISKVECSRYKYTRTDLTRFRKETIIEIVIEKPVCSNFKLVKDDGKRFKTITDIIVNIKCSDIKLVKREYIPPTPPTPPTPTPTPTPTPSKLR